MSGREREWREGGKERGKEREERKGGKERVGGKESRRGREDRKERRERKGRKERGGGRDDHSPSFSEVATGRSEVPYDNLQGLGVQVYGIPPGIPFHSPLLYNQQQLQQILANLEKIVFLKVGSPVST